MPKHVFNVYDENNDANIFGTKPLPPPVKLWILRSLILLECHQKLICSHGFENDRLASAIGLEDWVSVDEYTFMPGAVKKDLLKLYHQAEKDFPTHPVPDLLQNNVRKLAELIGLNDTDCRILEFAALLYDNKSLQQVTYYLEDLTNADVTETLSTLLDIPAKEVRDSLNHEGRLKQSGLLSIDRRFNTYLRNKIDLPSEYFAEQIVAVDCDPIDLLRGKITKSKKPHLTLEDYPHIDKELRITLSYVKQSLKAGDSGVNIFIYCMPGVGKTQLAMLIAHETGCELFEVNSEEHSGEPITGEYRLRSFNTAQCIIPKSTSLLLFDEAEDVFNDGNDFFGRKSTAEQRKAWINSTLENNPVPTIWLSNSNRGIDPAFVRRFDFIFELPVPPKKQRQKIISKACAGLLSEQMIVHFSESDVLTPAIISRAAKVATKIKHEHGENHAASTFELLINNTLETQRHERIRAYDPDNHPVVFDPAYIHSEADIESIADGMKQVQSGRICLYGPPGTGKTAFGRWIADYLEKSLLIKRGSDLLSKWVGGTEHNIRNAFKEATNENAVLMIDEVDSFLQDRRHAKNNWEITGVNEMLTQIESYSGVFLASTNLMDNLDQAVLRRFDIKIKLDYLLPEQAYDLFRYYCECFSIEIASAQSLSALRKMNNLTPGDFAAIARRNKFSPVKTAESFIHALQNECALKSDAVKQRIGFV